MHSIEFMENWRCIKLCRKDDILYALLYKHKSPFYPKQNPVFHFTKKLKKKETRTSFYIKQNSKPSNSVQVKVILLNVNSHVY